VNSGTT